MTDIATEERMNKTSKLLVFGDSWPAGAEVFDKTKTFPNVLGQLLNTQIIDLSREGSSIDEAVFYFLQHFENTQDTSDCKVLFCLTAPERTMMLPDGESIQQLHPNKQSAHSATYYKYFYSEDMVEYNLIRNMLLIQTFCELNKIPLYFVFNWDHAPRHKLIDPSKIYSKSLINIIGMDNDKDLADQFKTNEYVGKCHPNIQGHNLIAEELAKWIN